jgi:DNA polymerase-3 subunit epsilon
VTSDGGNDDTCGVPTPVRWREDWPRQPETEAGSGSEANTAALAEPRENVPPLRRVCVLDVETTGLDPVRHHVIELCTAAVLVDARGKIVGVPALKWGQEDPGYPLPPKITKLTGITDADVQGRSMCRDQVTQFITGCDAVVAFNAAFADITL